MGTTWRSGSTFLGDLLNRNPGVFYYFEPLHYYSQMTKKEKAESQEPEDFLRSLYTCSFTSRNVGFLHHVAVPANKFLLKNHNKRLWNSCANLLPRETMCLLPEYLNQICPLYPIRLIKTVRLRVAKVEPLLKDPAMDLKVVMLVRDPRGVYNSRGSGPVTTWCKQEPLYRHTHVKGEDADGEEPSHKEAGAEKRHIRDGKELNGDGVCLASEAGS